MRRPRCRVAHVSRSESGLFDSRPRNAALHESANGRYRCKNRRGAAWAPQSNRNEQIFDQPYVSRADLESIQPGRLFAMLARVPVDFHLGQQLGRDMLRGDDQTGKTKAVRRDGRIR